MNIIKKNVIKEKLQYIIIYKIMNLITKLNMFKESILSNFNIENYQKGLLYAWGNLFYLIVYELPVNIKSDYNYIKKTT
jgi:hypothetical protein